MLCARIARRRPPPARRPRGCACPRCAGGRSSRSRARSCAGRCAAAATSSWWMTASGRAAATRVAHGARVERVGDHRLGAGRAQLRRARSGERVMPVTSWPSASSIGTSCGRSRRSRRRGRPSCAARRAPRARCAEADSRSAARARADHALAEARRAHVERGVEARAHVLQRDRCSSAPRSARSSKCSRSAANSSSVTCDGRDGHRDRVVEHEPLERVEERALAVAGQGEQLLVADARAARHRGADVHAVLAA